MHTRWATEINLGQSLVKRIRKRMHIKSFNHKTLWNNFSIALNLSKSGKGCGIWWENRTRHVNKLVCAAHTPMWKVTHAAAAAAKLG